MVFWGSSGDPGFLGPKFGHVNKSQFCLTKRYPTIQLWKAAPLHIIIHQYGCATSEYVIYLSCARFQLSEENGEMGWKGVILGTFGPFSGTRISVGSRKSLLPFKKMSHYPIVTAHSATNHFLVFRVRSLRVCQRSELCNIPFLRIIAKSPFYRIIRPCHIFDILLSCASQRSTMVGDVVTSKTITWAPNSKWVMIDKSWKCVFAFFYFFIFFDTKKKNYDRTGGTAWIWPI